MIEEMFLSALVEKNSLKDIFDRGISDNVFVSPKNKKIYRYCIDCLTSYGHAPSPEALKEKFDFDLVEVKDSVGNLADLLIERYRKIELEQVLLSGAEKINENPEVALRYIMDRTSRLLLETSDKRKKYDYIAHSEERIREYLEKRESKDIMGCPTGWPLFDEWTLGLQKGELGVLFAGTGKGKTYTMLRMAVGAYSSGWSPIVLSFEPSIKSLYQRLDSIIARISPRRYRAGELSEEEYERLENRLRMLRQYDRPFVLIKPINNQPSSIIEAIYENRLGEDENWVVFIDQMAFLSSRGERFEYYKNLFLDITRIISPNNLNIPCWILAQENREGQRAGQAQIINIALSSFTEQFADIVLNLYREGYDSNSAILRILKFREGRPADFALKFDLDNGVIEVAGILSAA